MAGSQCQAERPEQGAAGRSNKAEADRLASARLAGQKAEAGYAAITWPTEFGGLGAHQYNRSFIRRKNRISKYPAGFRYRAGHVIPTMMAWATKEQNERF
ncbi:MAG: hypothetical protein CM15mP21_1520 [Hyphomicrobiales bacterium]|nr:MAG: hypothetical protein CM15mP21_1520 [Hyphomicrobiales bacterium]